MMAPMTAKPTDVEINEKQLPRKRRSRFMVSILCCVEVMAAYQVSGSARNLTMQVSTLRSTRAPPAGLEACIPNVDHARDAITVPPPDRWPSG